MRLPPAGTGCCWYCAEKAADPIEATGGMTGFVEECVVVEAVAYEPVSTLFPANRELIRRNQEWTPRREAKRVYPYGLSAAIPCATEQAEKSSDEGCRTLRTAKASARSADAPE